VPCVGPNAGPSVLTSAAMCGSNNPWWPPITAVLRGSSKPSYLEFATMVAREAGIPVGKLRMAKLGGTKKVRACQGEGGG
jgi:hypothetical protein